MCVTVCVCTYIGYTHAYVYREFWGTYNIQEYKLALKVNIFTFLSIHTNYDRYIYIVLYACCMQLMCSAIGYPANCVSYAQWVGYSVVSGDKKRRNRELRVID